MQEQLLVLVITQSSLKIIGMFDIMTKLKSFMTTPLTPMNGTIKVKTLDIKI